MNCSIETKRTFTAYNGVFTNYSNELDEANTYGKIFASPLLNQLSPTHESYDIIKQAVSGFSTFKDFW